MVLFDGKQYVEMMPPQLCDMLSTSDGDTRSALQQERDFAAAMDSEEFRRTIDLLRQNTMSYPISR
jgi:hypothetical protein